VDSCGASYELACCLELANCSRAPDWTTAPAVEGTGTISTERWDERTNLISLLLRVLHPLCLF